VTKSELRRHIRSIMREYTPTQLEALSHSVISQLLAHPKVQQADTIVLYHSLPDEVNTHTLIDTLHRQGKRILLPKVVSPTAMTLHEYHGADSLSTGAYGILEPIGNNNNNCQLSTVNCQLIIVPALAFDRQGNRLGRGKGYYDRLLSQIEASAPIYKIGVCFPFQLLESIPHDSFDIPMDEVICS